MYPKILALDFDGVVCDGLLEYFQSTKRAYQIIFSGSDGEELDTFAEPFYRLRPVIETGWEMIILLRALVLTIPEARIIKHWSETVIEILHQEQIDPEKLMQTLDQVRDYWIEHNLEEWLHLHHFYPGIIPRLQQLQEMEMIVYIITTKEGRFVQQLLAEQAVNLSPEQILGKEVRQPKYKSLEMLLNQHQIAANQLWFVEDLLKTLQTIKQQDSLKNTVLFLADWGYNTPETRASLTALSSIHLLSLMQFSQDFPQWLIPNPSVQELFPLKTPG